MSELVKAGERNHRQVGYFCHLKVDDKHMGGMLITNQVGIPLEFKYTEPVVATKLHKILYGSVLEKYLHETVIRDRLGAEIRMLPEFFIAPYDEKEFLGPIKSREMVAIQKYNMPPGELSGPFNRIRDREAVIELEEESLLLRLAFSTTNESVQHDIAAWLQEIARTMNLLEPMDRIASALKSICGEGGKG
ncbi:MAG: hypothetical protein JW793_10520 [Acidobacteria bacterium]|nr:hypothetical protein [Acidobacteriota bacterium]